MNHRVAQHLPHRPRDGNWFISTAAPVQPAPRRTPSTPAAVDVRWMSMIGTTGVTDAPPRRPVIKPQPVRRRRRLVGIIASFDGSQTVSPSDTAFASAFCRDRPDCPPSLSPSSLTVPGRQRCRVYHRPRRRVLRAPAAPSVVPPARHTLSQRRRVCPFPPAAPRLPGPLRRSTSAARSAQGRRVQNRFYRLDHPASTSGNTYASPLPASAVNASINGSSIATV